MRCCLVAGAMSIAACFSPRAPAPASDGGVTVVADGPAACDPVAQGDEDGDGVADGCDACPWVAGTVDGDGDGVGDRCDPDAMTRHTILAFEGFHAGIPTSWKPSAGWTSRAGAAHVVAGDRNDGERIVAPVAPPAAATVSAGFVRDGAALGDIVEVALPYGPGTDGASCTLSPFNAQGTAWSITMYDDASKRSAGKNFTWATTATHFVLALSRVGANYTCTVVDALSPDVNTAQQQLSGTAATATPGGPSVGAYDAEATFEWVLVVGQN